MRFFSSASIALRLSMLGLVVASTTLSGARATAAPHHRFDPLVIDLDGSSSFRAPVTNDNDDVVFQMLDSTGHQHIMGTNARAGGPLLTIHGLNFGYEVTGPPSVSNGGMCVVPGGDATGKGIFARSVSGGAILTLRGNNFGLAEITKPAIGNGGTLAFHGVDDVGATGVYARSSGGVLITVVGSDFSSASAPKVTGLDTVFVTAQEGGASTTGLYARRGGGVLLTIEGSNFGSSIRTFDVNDNDDVVFVATDDLGTEGLFRSSPGGFTGTIPWLDFAGGSVNSVALNDGGTLVCGKTTHLRGSDLIEEIFVTDLDGSYSIPVIAVGDALMDSTVTELLMTEGSLSNSNRFAFHATLADGSSGVFSVRVPAPGAGAVISTAVGCACIRRRRC